MLIDFNFKYRTSKSQHSRNYRQHITHVAVIPARDRLRHLLRTLRAQRAVAGNRLLLCGPLWAVVALPAGRGGLGEAGGLTVGTSWADRVYSLQAGVVGIRAWKGRDDVALNVYEFGVRYE